jgi:hypothetical protein
METTLFNNCRFHSIKPVYRNHGNCQAEYNSIAEEWSIPLYGSNEIVRGDGRCFEVLTRSVVRRQRLLVELLGKKLWPGQADDSVTPFSRNFFRIRLFVIQKFFLGPELSTEFVLVPHLRRYTHSHIQRRF